MVARKSQLFACLVRLAQLQRERLDKVALEDAVQGVEDEQDAVQKLIRIAACLHAKAPRFLRKPDVSKMPALMYAQANNWFVVRGKNAQGLWILERFDPTSGRWQEQEAEQLTGSCLALVSTAPPFAPTRSPVFRLIRRQFFSHRRLLTEALVGAVMINIVALAIAFYTMQVYDRVVPTGATQTLLVLTIGVAVAVLYEWAVKHYRSHLFDQLVFAVDQHLARQVYGRLLSIRLDQLPPNVGTLAAQMKGYESVRAFLTSMTSHLVVDMPFTLLYLLLMYIIAGNLAFIPLVFLLVSWLVGTYFRQRLDDLSTKVNHAANFKTGLLVESVEGAETIKSGQGGWRMLNRWMDTNDAARTYELSMKRISERSQHMIAAFQQTAYVALVSSGALMVSAGELSMGALLACSILSGRILAPLAAIPNILQQWSHTKAAIKSLDAIWMLEDDHAGIDHPLVPETVAGNYKLEGVVSFYGDKLALSVTDLSINAGEKVAVLGPVGAGKTTLLRLLSGMYKPQEGRVLLDDMELAHIAKPVLAEQMGYLQQEGRLFAGSFRENLTLGLLDPGDEAIFQAAKISGLYDSVIGPSAEGLQTMIHEGGQGLSAGQRQLLNLTRIFLRQPNIWLLDEPTAAMDSGAERTVIKAFQKTLKAADTLVVVTHKADILSLVDRIIVIANHQVIMDGDKSQILKLLAEAQSHEVAEVSL